MDWAMVGSLKNARLESSGEVTEIVIDFGDYRALVLFREGETPADVASKLRMAAHHIEREAKEGYL